MQIDFHYYAAYCAARLAGFDHGESLAICTASQYVDCCTRTSLKKMKAPLAAATTQTQMKMMDVRPGLLSLQDITRIWASFHFLPGDLYATGLLPAVPEQVPPCLPAQQRPIKGHPGAGEENRHPPGLWPCHARFGRHLGPPVFCRDPLYGHQQHYRLLLRGPDNRRKRGMEKGGFPPQRQ